MITCYFSRNFKKVKGQTLKTEGHSRQSKDQVQMFRGKNMLCFFKECQRPAGKAGVKFMVHKSRIIEDHGKDKNFLLRDWKSSEVLSRAVTVTDFLLRRTAVVAVLRIFYIGQGLK